jgi:hypothetical protein
MRRPTRKRKFAQFTGFALQEDIALRVRRLQQLGRDILDRSPRLTGGHGDGHTIDFARQVASSAPAIQLGIDHVVGYPIRPSVAGCCAISNSPLTCCRSSRHGCARSGSSGPL